MTSILTHDLAFKVEPEESSHKCYIELFFVRLLICLTRMSAASLVLLFTVFPCPVPLLLEMNTHNFSNVYIAMPNNVVCFK